MWYMWFKFASWVHPGTFKLTLHFRIVAYVYPFIKTTQNKNSNVLFRSIFHI